jgi:CheY-like chemotaxis protein
LHNGTVDVDSDGENQGATFTVKLPLLPDDLNESDAQLLPNESSLAQIETRSELENLQILVVDDQPDVCEILTVVLQGSGAKVTAVYSAAAAIKAIAQLQPDILISDIGMPDEDGYTLLGKIRNLDIKQGGQIPAIALTAYVRQEDYTNALLAGFQMHLSKPVDSTELIKAVAELTGRIQKIA